MSIPHNNVMNLNNVMKVEAHCVGKGCVNSHNTHHNKLPC